MTEPIRSKECRVGRGFTVEFTFLPHQCKLKADWSPWPPDRKEMRRVLPAYRTAREGFLSRVTEATGMSVEVLEVAL